MKQSRRSLALAAALTMTVGVGVATAQTVVLRGAPAGSAVEVLLNTAAAGSGTADPSGDAQVALKRPADLGDEIDVRFFVDTCGKQYRVLLIERGLEPKDPVEGCTRKEMPGFFVMRRVTTFVIDVGGVTPLMWFRQGQPPEEWLSHTAPGESSPRVWQPLPTGLVFFGGGAFTTFRDATTLSCGTAVECNGGDFKRTYAAGVEYWLTRFAGVEASFVRPANVDVSGSDTGFTFNSSLDTRLFTIAGKGAVPVGPVRIYGKGGVNYQQTTFATSETVDPKALTLEDGTTQTVPGGTQSWFTKTEGWGWLFGGGVEVWAGRRFAIYAEAGRAKLKGQPVGGGEGALNERVNFVLFGARVHIIG